MKRAALVLVGGLIAVTAAVTQDLPPGTLLLSRIKAHVKSELQRLPNVSCLETVQREHQAAKGLLRPLDTICLEVHTNGNKEFFASPGDRKFSERHPIDYAGAGVLGDGFFGPYRRDILVTGNASSEYKGEEEFEGRHLARYDFRLPLMWSGQSIQILEGSGKVGLRGSFWADPESYDIVRLEMNADEIPPSLPIKEAVTRIRYAPARLREDLIVLLPRSAEFRMVKYTGEISRNMMEFTHCHAFGVESEIRFAEPGASERAPRFGIATIDDTIRPMAAGLKVAVKLRSRVTAETTVGTLIDGELAANVPEKGAIVVPARSPVRGRIRRLERYTDPLPYFVVALEFTELESGGVRYRFYADLVEIEPAAGVEQSLSSGEKTEVVDWQSNGQKITRTKETLRLTQLPGVATFFYKGRKLELPYGLRTVWRTRSLRSR